MIEKQFAAHIGLDWADEKHDYCLRVAGSQTLEYGIFEHTPALIAQWALALKDRFKDQPIAVCLELKSGPIVSCLSKYDFIRFFLLRPRHWQITEKYSPKVVPKMIQAMLFCSLII